MRKITREIVEHFRNGRAIKIGNSRTNGQALYLHDNKIAEYINGELWVTNAGWQTNTTKERLNGLPDVRIQQIRGTWYLNDIAWTGQWVKVSEFIGSTSNEVEYDMRSEWTERGYSRPVYSVYHTHTETDLGRVEEVLRADGIECRRSESDTAGEYKINYFLVVLPADYEKAKRLTDEL